MKHSPIIQWSVITSLIFSARNIVAVCWVPLVAIFLSAFVSAKVLAVGEGAHTHGTANLTLAFDRESLEVYFESPAMNLLGFEHAPSTQQHEDIINTVKALLNSPEKVLFIQGNKCSPNKVSVNIVGPASQGLNGAHEHDHQHSDEHHGDQDIHGEDGEHDQGHSEVSASYLFNCTDNDVVESVTVSLFEHFSGLEKIKVNWVTETQQGETVLRSTSSRIDFQ